MIRDGKKLSMLSGPNGSVLIAQAGAKRRPGLRSSPVHSSGPEGPVPPAVSIPYVLFVEFDFVPAQQLPQFVLE